MVHATTIICIRHKGKIAMAGDGQVSIGQTVLKQKANKIRILYKGSGRICRGDFGRFCPVFQVRGKAGRISGESFPGSN